MSEQLISLETAKLAKEKGFIQNPYNTPNAYLPRYTDGGDIHLNSSLFSPKNNIAVVPTQSLLQKWLREVHSIHISLSVNQFGYGFHYSIIDLKVSNCIVLLSCKTGGPNYKYSYEQALEAGLYKALQLIKKHEKEN